MRRSEWWTIFVLPGVLSWWLFPELRINTKITHTGRYTNWWHDNKRWSSHINSESHSLCLYFDDVTNDSTVYNVRYRQCFSHASFENTHIDMCSVESVDWAVSNRIMLTGFVLNSADNHVPIAEVLGQTTPVWLITKLETSPDSYQTHNGCMKSTDQQDMFCFNHKSAFYTSNNIMKNVDE